MRLPLVFRAAFLLAAVCFVSVGLSAEILRIGTYNVENYLIMDRLVEGRWRPDYPKPEIDKSALRGVIAAVDPDILALQEMGSKPFLDELQRDLKREGVDYPYSYLLEGPDEVRHLAVLSRIPFQEVHEHIDLDFPYRGGRETIRRGLLEIVFETGGETWSLFVVHLKSKWTEYPDDPNAEQKRTGEATAARNRILERYDPEKGALYLIAGDFNDTRDTPTLRRFLRRGPVTISHIISAVDSNGLNWTQHWERQGIYSQFDYLLASPALFERQLDGQCGIFDGDGADLASDHRLVWADFQIVSQEAVAVDGEEKGPAALLQRFR